MNRQTLERAAFWDHAICLDCSNEQEREPGIPEAECEECGSPAVFPASLILACADFVED